MSKCRSPESYLLQIITHYSLLIYEQDISRLWQDYEYTDTHCEHHELGLHVHDFVSNQKCKNAQQAVIFI